ncbi:MAG: hypothetical protein H0U71_04250 [Gammaproteobacteria bacterium]|nr:hypothetical protein [Gammaproteobacteria bacterium]
MSFSKSRVAEINQQELSDALALFLPLAAKGDTAASFSRNAAIPAHLAEYYSWFPSVIPHKFVDVKILELKALKDEFLAEWLEIEGLPADQQKEEKAKRLFDLEKEIFELVDSRFGGFQQDMIFRLAKTAEKTDFNEYFEHYTKKLEEFLHYSAQKKCVRDYNRAIQIDGVEPGEIEGSEKKKMQSFEEKLIAAGITNRRLIDFFLTYSGQETLTAVGYFFVSRQKSALSLNQRELITSEKPTLTLNIVNDKDNDDSAIVTLLSTENEFYGAPVGRAAPAKILQDPQSKIFIQCRVSLEGTSDYKVEVLDGWHDLYDPEVRKNYINTHKITVLSRIQQGVTLGANDKRIIDLLSQSYKNANGDWDEPKIILADPGTLSLLMWHDLRIAKSLVQKLPKTFFTRPQNEIDTDFEMIKAKHHYSATVASEMDKFRELMKLIKDQNINGIKSALKTNPQQMLLCLHSVKAKPSLHFIRKLLSYTEIKANLDISVLKHFALQHSTLAHSILRPTLWERFKFSLRNFLLPENKRSKTPHHLFESRDLKEVVETFPQFWTTLFGKPKTFSPFSLNYRYKLEGAELAELISVKNPRNQSFKNSLNNITLDKKLEKTLKDHHPVYSMSEQAQYLKESPLTLDDIGSKDDYLGLVAGLTDEELSSLFKHKLKSVNSNYLIKVIEDLWTDGKKNKKWTHVAEKKAVFKKILLSLIADKEIYIENFVGQMEGRMLPARIKITELFMNPPFSQGYLCEDTLVLARIRSEAIEEGDKAHFQTISQKNNNRPLLIKHGSKVSLYTLSQGEWKTIELSAALFAKLKFPHRGKTSVVDKKTLTPPMYNEITRLKGPVLTQKKEQDLQVELLNNVSIFTDLFDAPPISDDSINKIAASIAADDAKANLFAELMKVSQFWNLIISSPTLFQAMQKLFNHETFKAAALKNPALKKLNKKLGDQAPSLPTTKSHVTFAELNSNAIFIAKLLEIPGLYDCFEQLRVSSQFKTLIKNQQSQFLFKTIWDLAKNKPDRYTVELAALLPADELIKWLSYNPKERERFLSKLASNYTLYEQYTIAQHDSVPGRYSPYGKCNPPTEFDLFFLKSLDHSQLLTMVLNSEMFSGVYFNYLNNLSGLGDAAAQKRYLREFISGLTPTELGLIIAKYPQFLYSVKEIGCHKDIDKKVIEAIKILHPILLESSVQSARALNDGTAEAIASFNNNKNEIKNTIIQTNDLALESLLAGEPSQIGLRILSELNNNPPNNKLISFMLSHQALMFSFLSQNDSKQMLAVAVKLQDKHLSDDLKQYINILLMKAIIDPSFRHVVMNNSEIEKLFSAVGDENLIAQLLLREPRDLGKWFNGLERIMQDPKLVKKCLPILDKYQNFGAWLLHQDKEKRQPFYKTLSELETQDRKPFYPKETIEKLIGAFINSEKFHYARSDAGEVVDWLLAQSQEAIKEEPSIRKILNENDGSRKNLFKHVPARQFREMLTIAYHELSLDPNSKLASDILRPPYLYHLLDQGSQQDLELLFGNFDTYKLTESKTLAYKKLIALTLDRKDIRDKVLASNVLTQQCLNCSVVEDKEAARNLLIEILNLPNVPSYIVEMLTGENSAYFDLFVEPGNSNGLIKLFLATLKHKSLSALQTKILDTDYFKLMFPANLNQGDAVRNINPHLQQQLLIALFKLSKEDKLSDACRECLKTLQLQEDVTYLKQILAGLSADELVDLFLADDVSYLINRPAHFRAHFREDLQDRLQEDVTSFKQILAGLSADELDDLFLPGDISYLINPPAHFRAYFKEAGELQNLIFLYASEDRLVSLFRQSPDLAASFAKKSLTQVPESSLTIPLRKRICESKLNLVDTLITQLRGDNFALLQSLMKDEEVADKFLSAFERNPQYLFTESKVEIEPEPGNDGNNILSIQADAKPNSSNPQDQTFEPGYQYLFEQGSAKTIIRLLEVGISGGYNLVAEYLRDQLLPDEQELQNNNADENKIAENLARQLNNPESGTALIEALLKYFSIQDFIGIFIKHPDIDTAFISYFEETPGALSKFIEDAPADFKNIFLDYWVASKQMLRLYFLINKEGNNNLSLLNYTDEFLQSDVIGNRQKLLLHVKTAEELVKIYSYESEKEKSSLLSSILESLKSPAFKERFLAVTDESVVCDILERKSPAENNDQADNDFISSYYRSFNEVSEKNHAISFSNALLKDTPPPFAHKLGYIYTLGLMLNSNIAHCSKHQQQGKILTHYASFIKTLNLLVMFNESGDLVFKDDQQKIPLKVAQRFFEANAVFFYNNKYSIHALLENPAIAASITKTIEIDPAGNLKNAHYTDAPPSYYAHMALYAYCQLKDINQQLQGSPGLQLAFMASVDYRGNEIVFKNTNCAVPPKYRDLIASLSTKESFLRLMGQIALDQNGCFAVQGSEPISQEALSTLKLYITANYPSIESMDKSTLSLALHIEVEKRFPYRDKLIAGLPTLVEGRTLNEEEALNFRQSLILIASTPPTGLDPAPSEKLLRLISQIIMDPGEKNVDLHAPKLCFKPRARTEKNAEIPPYCYKFIYDLDLFNGQALAKKFNGFAERGENLQRASRKIAPIPAQKSDEALIRELLGIQPVLANENRRNNKKGQHNPHQFFAKAAPSLNPGDKNLPEVAPTPATLPNIYGDQFEDNDKGKKSKDVSKSLKNSPYTPTNMVHRSPIVTGARSPAVPEHQSPAVIEHHSPAVQSVGN